MRIFNVLLCVSVYITIVDWAEVRALHRHEKIYGWLGWWTLTALAAVIAVQCQRRASERKVLLHSLLVLVVALSPWFFLTYA